MNVLEWVVIFKLDVNVKGSSFNLDILHPLAEMVRRAQLCRYTACQGLGCQEFTGCKSLHVVICMCGDDFKGPPTLPFLDFFDATLKRFPSSGAKIFLARSSATREDSHTPYISQDGRKHCNIRAPERQHVWPSRSSCLASEKLYIVVYMHKVRVICKW